MPGPLIIILILVVVIPVGFLVSMMALSAFMGSVLRRNVAEIHKGSELLAMAESENVIQSEH